MTRVSRREEGLADRGVVSALRADFPSRRLDATALPSDFFAMHEVCAGNLAASIRVHPPCHLNFLSFIRVALILSGALFQMKLPNVERAFVDIAKLRDYSLDPVHPEGKHKARVFAAALGLSRNDANWLCGQLLAVARTHDCRPGRKTEHGQRYVLDFTLSHGGKSALVRSVWNVRPAEDFPRLVTCFVP